MKPMCCLKRAGGVGKQEEALRKTPGRIRERHCATSHTGEGGSIAQRPLQETLLEWVNWKSIVGSLLGSFNYKIIW